MFKGKQANILAAVIIGTVILAASAVLLTQLAPGDKKVDAQQRVTAEADNTMRQAIALSINEWMQNGFSNQNKLWYSTGALPPDFDEAVVSLHEITNQKVGEYMDLLKKENDEYYIAPEVKVNYDVTEPLSDDLDQLNARVTEFKVGLENQDYSQIEDISQTYAYPYQAWLMYSNMVEWMRTNADDMTGNLWQAMVDQGCQLVSGGCTCDNVEITESQKESIRFRPDDVTPVIDSSVQALTDMFAGTDITCSYEIEMMNIENTEKIAFAQGDVGPNGTLFVVPREADYTYSMRRWEDEQRTRPQGDSCGGLPQGPGGSVPADCTVRPLLLDADGNPVDDGSDQSYMEPDPDHNEVCADVGDDSQSITYQTEMLAMDKKVAILLNVRCQDPSTSIETPHGLEPLSAEIGMRLAIALECPLPTNNRDMYADQELYGRLPGSCPGGSCFPAGTMITMADYSTKPIEDVKLGEWVLSYNTFTGEFKPGQVLELESPVREGLYTIIFEDGSTIEVTNEHPFYTKKADGTTGWASIQPEATYEETKSIDNVLPLEIGDYVLKVDRQWSRIIGISYQQKDVQTYNLKEVSYYDNFFAGDNLVHNKCCFAAGTLISMADGTTKPIEDVLVGDYVMTYNEATGNLEPAEVLELQKPVREGIYIVTFDNGKILEVTNDHPLMTRDGWAAIDVDAALAGYALNLINPLVVGSEVLQEDMTYAKVSSIEYLSGDIQTYTLKKVDKNRNFFANGFLAHNQKLIGFIGLACNKDCPPCYGCAPAPGVSNPDPDIDSDWICEGPIPNLICGKCGLCDAAGECTIPQVAGYPCFDENGDNMMAGTGASGYGGGNVDYADCMACDGTNTGDPGCVMNPPSIIGAILIPCDGNLPCAMCDGSGNSPAAGGCSAPLAQDTTCNDESLDESDRRCQICQAGVVGSCQPDSDMDNENCGSCLYCLAGTCSAPDTSGAIGHCSTPETPCMRCSETVAGACEVDTSLQACEVCKTCGADGSCVADTAQNGNACGVCHECLNGQCVAANEGEQCRESDGCLWSCQSGSCTLSNAGASCTKTSNNCGLDQRCSEHGCETVGSDQQFFCCGGEWGVANSGVQCAQGSPCCPYLNKCEPCPSTV